MTWHPSRPTGFYKQESFTHDGKEYNSGDVVRIDGEHGTRFIFLYFVVNMENGKEWIDCIEMQKGQYGPYRSFNKDRLRWIPPKKRPVVK